MNALIGYTGFVGSNIANQKKFDFYYNSKNIEEIKGKSFDLLVCAGARSIKWKANKLPKQDYQEIQKLIFHLDSCYFKKIVLISTIAVYDNPADNTYGQNRLYLETYIKNKFSNVTIIRLPALFGKGLKKNAIYDMINNKYDYLPNLKSKFQYYYLNNLWKDIEIALKNKLSVLNISPEPVLFSKIFNLFKIKNLDLTEAPVVNENMKTKYAYLWNKDGDYIYTSDQAIQDLKNFLKEQNK